jgi:hypothetical protein
MREATESLRQMGQRLSREGLEQEYQVERDWRSPAMSSLTMRRAL